MNKTHYKQADNRRGKKTKEAKQTHSHTIKAINYAEMIYHETKDKDIRRLADLLVSEVKKI